MIAAAPSMLPEWMASWAPRGEEPPQNLKEYDPEWAGAFWSGTATIGCDHARMLKSVKVQVLFTHHFRKINPVNGALMGAVSDQQVNEARRLVDPASASSIVRFLKWAIRCMAKTQRFMRRPSERDAGLPHAV